MLLCSESIRSKIHTRKAQQSIKSPIQGSETGQTGKGQRRAQLRRDTLKVSDCKGRAKHLTMQKASKCVRAAQRQTAVHLTATGMMHTLQPSKGLSSPSPAHGKQSLVRKKTAAVLQVRSVLDSRFWADSCSSMEYH